MRVRGPRILFDLPIRGCPLRLLLEFLSELCVLLLQHCVLLPDGSCIAEIPTTEETKQSAEHSENEALHKTHKTCRHQYRRECNKCGIRQMRFNPRKLAPKNFRKNYMSDKIVFTRSCSFRTEPIEFAEVIETESSAPLIRVV